MQGARGQVGHVKIKLVDGIVPISGRNVHVIVDSLNGDILSVRKAMKPNGPAIKRAER
jgi:hypothetical protein